MPRVESSRAGAPVAIPLEPSSPVPDDLSRSWTDLLVFFSEHLISEEQFYKIRNGRYT